MQMSEAFWLKVLWVLGGEWRKEMWMCVGVEMRMGNAADTPSIYVCVINPI